MREVARIGFTVPARSLAAKMPTTPGIVAAAAPSMRRSRAWACTLRRSATWTSRGGWRSSTKVPAPVSSRGSSSRCTRAPTSFGRTSSIALRRPAPGDRCPYCVDNVLAAGAATEIAAEAVADFVVGSERPLAQEIDGGHQHPRRAEPALQRVMLAERLLQTVELLDGAEAFDGLERAAVGLHREQQAGAHAVAVENDSAGAADAMLAADMGAGEAERLAQEVAEQAARFGGLVI